MKRNNTDHDLLLIRNVLNGNTAEFGVLVKKYQELSFSLACSVLKDEHRAEEATHEAFIKAYRKLSTFKGNSSFATWLYRIVVNTALNRLSRSGTPAKASDTYAGEPGSEANAGVVRLFDNDRRHHINNALDLLKPEEALMLRLFYLAELSVTEIRGITGFGESKIKVTLHRARKNMLEVLERSLGNELKHLL